MPVRPSHRTVSLLVVAVVAVAATAARAVRAPEAPQVIMYKGAQCNCCLGWGEQLTAAGYTLEVRIPDDLSAVFAEHAVPPDLMSCHLAVIGGYTVVGHVPIAEIERMLRERPDIAGIAVPGMPAGAPGMEYPGTEPSPYDVVAFGPDGETSVYARY